MKKPQFRIRQTEKGWITEYKHGWWIFKKWYPFSFYAGSNSIWYSKTEEYALMSLKIKVIDCTEVIYL